MLHLQDQKLKDLENLKRIVQREQTAFADFYDRHAPIVFAFLCRMLGQTDAEDILQETFWQVWQQASSYDPKRGSPLAWLIAIARSRGIDRLRKMNRHNQHLEVIEGSTAKEASLDSLMEAQTLVKEQNEQIRGAIAGLSPEQQKAITLAFFDGLTHIEIAKHLDTPLGTVKTRIREGMRKLQSLLQQPRKAL